MTWDARTHSRSVYAHCRHTGSWAHTNVWWYGIVVAQWHTFPFLEPIDQSSTDNDYTWEFCDEAKRKKKLKRDRTDLPVPASRSVHGAHVLYTTFHWSTHNAFLGHNRSFLYLNTLPNRQELMALISGRKAVLYTLAWHFLLLLQYRLPL